MAHKYSMHPLDFAPCPPPIVNITEFKEFALGLDLTTDEVDVITTRCYHLNKPDETCVSCGNETYTAQVSIIYGVLIASVIVFLIIIVYTLIRKYRTKYR